jgi:regulatory protein
MAFSSKPRRAPRERAPEERDLCSAERRTAARPARDKPAPAPGTAKRYLTWLLARREYAAADLRRKALAKGHAADEVEAALAAFQALGLQDDARYAGMKARQCAPRWGNRRVQQALKTKQIDAAVVARELAELPDEAERAARLLEPFSAQAWDLALKQKAWRRLASRGFSTGAIRSALAGLQAQCRASADGEEGE